MKNTFGNAVTITLFGESHGEGIGAVLDGIAPGIHVDKEFINKQLYLRIAGGAISTARKEPDEVEFLSGIYNDYTTGTPICLVIKNKNTQSKDYSKTQYLMRPGHADYTAQCKYHGYQDFRGGGHFSGRITAPLVACGAILINALRQKGIYIGTHISRCAKVEDIAFSDYMSDIKSLNSKTFAVLSSSVEEEMKSAIASAKADGDSVGGVLETAVIGLPEGVGEPWFDTVEGMISHALFSIPAIKGVEFGAGFSIADMTGSTANDELYYESGKVFTKTNNNGGINGGITNGMPVIFRSAVKPTPTIHKTQNTIDISTKENVELLNGGRHDPCIVHRARVVVDSITAIVLCDMLTGRFGTEWLVK